MQNSSCNTQHAIHRHSADSARSPRIVQKQSSSLVPRSSLLPRGMTLIELLVVVVILTTIVAAAIPLLSPSNDDRRMREAARGLNTYITGAQTRAIALNRPYGIILKRLARDTNRADDRGVCLEVFYVEQPPVYAGFSATSRCCVSIRQSGLAVIKFVARGNMTNDGLPSGWDADVFPSQMIGPGDVIEIGGTKYEMREGDQTGLMRSDPQRQSTKSGVSKYYLPPPPGQVPAALVRPLNDTGQQLNPRYDDDGFSLGADREPGAPTNKKSPYWTHPAPYKVLRQPTPASDDPYQLPEGTAIDLRASGVGSDIFFHNPLAGDPRHSDNSDDVYIMFAPEGRVSRVTFQLDPFSTNSPPVFDQSVVENLYLLVGRRENVPPPSIGSSKADDLSLQASEVSAANTDELRDKLRRPLNWLGGTSKWVVIGSQSGRIATVENNFVNLATIAALGSPSDTLRNEQIKTSRELTREIAQLGGR
jgi:prepilin-type N-terminal cleavage/methylation domain-containing protein